jgi:hypothetical protein
MVEALLLISFVAVGYDAYCTKRAIDKWGPKAELNPILRKVAEKNKSTLVPAIVGAAIGFLATIVAYGIDPMLLAFYAGMRTDLAIRQMYAQTRGLI